MNVTEKYENLCKDLEIEIVDFTKFVGAGVDIIDRFDETDGQSLNIGEFRSNLDLEYGLHAIRLRPIGEHVTPTYYSLNTMSPKVMMGQILRVNTTKFKNVSRPAGARINKRPVKEGYYDYLFDSLSAFTGTGNLGVISPNVYHGNFTHFVLLPASLINYVLKLHQALKPIHYSKFGPLRKELFSLVFPFFLKYGVWVRTKECVEPTNPLGKFLTKYDFFYHKLKQVELKDPEIFTKIVMFKLRQREL